VFEVVGVPRPLPLMYAVMGFHSVLCIDST
jgi:hypothetical protein